jgi:hypothetical protein
MHNARLFVRLAWRGLVKGLRDRGIIPPAHDLSGAQVVSYPKSGRTWLRLILDALYLDLHYHHDTAEALYKPEQDFDPEGADPSDYGDARIVYMIRDPRDVIVSSYFQATRRERTWNGGLGEFLRHPKLGFEALVRFQQHWLGLSDDLHRMLVVSYEDMQADAPGRVAAVTRFLGAGRVSARRIERAVRLYTFDRMQESERSGILKVFYGGKLKPGDPDDAEAYKARRGRVGGYVDYLAAEQVAWCNEVMSGLGSPYAVVAEG